ncbi:unnamed protein product [Miscanthus lutarioriparius]|uniref:Uncharacterized protein n=1 Tax=Miscanthus lutarioriparius TaxID=422564 RepID=A0A811N145_9POAL|nr:unnamed protein product [Miscanthus lutarioriparius]
MRLTRSSSLRGYVLSALLLLAASAKAQQAPAARTDPTEGQPDETEGGPSGELNITSGNIQTEPRNTSNQFIPDQLMQGHYVLGHNFGLGISQNLHDNLNQFDQASSVSTLQQQPFPGNGQLTQGYPSDMHGLQFVETTPQIDHQNGDEGQSSIPERHRMSFANDVEPMLEHRVARSNQSTEKDEGPNEDGWIKRKSKRDIVVEGC